MENFKNLTQLLKSKEECIFVLNESLTDFNFLKLYSYEYYISSYGEFYKNNKNKEYKKIKNIHHDLKLVLVMYISYVSEEIFKSNTENALNLILKLSNESLKVLLLLELFRNILLNINENSTNILNKIMENINVNNIKYFYHILTNEDTLFCELIKNQNTIYVKHFTSFLKHPEQFAKLKISAGDYTEALKYAKTNITKLHAYSLLKNFDSAYDEFLNIVNKKIKLTKKESLKLISMFDIIKFASDDKLNFLINLLSQCNIYQIWEKNNHNVFNIYNIITHYDDDKTNIFLEIILRLFNEKYTRFELHNKNISEKISNFKFFGIDFLSFVTKNKHSLEYIPNFNFFDISVICIAHICFKNYDKVENLLKDYSSFCETVGRRSDFVLINGSDTVYIRQMLLNVYKNCDINKYYSYLSKTEFLKKKHVVAISNSEKEIIDSLESFVEIGYFSQSHRRKNLYFLCEESLHLIALDYYKLHHTRENIYIKCDNECECAYKIAEIIENTNNLEILKMTIDTFLKFGSNNNKYEQINDLTKLAKKIRKNQTIFTNTLILDIKKNMIDYEYSFVFFIAIFVESFVNILDPNLFQHMPK